jgi:hypothetical protein
VIGCERIGRFQLFTLLNQPHRDDGRIGVGPKGRLDAVIAGKRLGQRRRQMAAGGNQQRRGDVGSSRDRHRFTSLLIFLLCKSGCSSQALGMVTGRDSRLCAASLIAALAAPNP